MAGSIPAASTNNCNKIKDLRINDDKNSPFYSPEIARMVYFLVNIFSEFSGQNLATADPPEMSFPFGSQRP
jgi:hypothetical protein